MGRAGDGQGQEYHVPLFPLKGVRGADGEAVSVDGDRGSAPARYRVLLW